MYGYLMQLTHQILLAQERVKREREGRAFARIVKDCSASGDSQRAKDAAVTMIGGMYVSTKAHQDFSAEFSRYINDRVLYDAKSKDMMRELKQKLNWREESKLAPKPTVDPKPHPLHSVDFIANHVRSTGYYPGNRRTGRSTAQALAYLAEAIANPGKRIAIRDHHGTAATNIFLRQTMQGMADRLGLHHLTFTNDTVTFG